MEAVSATRALQQAHAGVTSEGAACLKDRLICLCPNDFSARHARGKLRNSSTAGWRWAQVVLSGRHVFCSTWYCDRALLLLVYPQVSFSAVQGVPSEVGATL